jgi:hypothetical protein
MCNVVCAGIGQFFGPIILGLAVAIIGCAILGAIGRAIGRDMARASEERRLKPLREAWQKKHVAELPGRIELARAVLSYNGAEIRADLTRAQPVFNWSPEELEANIAGAEARYNGYAPYYRSLLEELERELAASK